MRKSDSKSYRVTAPLLRFDEWKITKDKKGHKNFFYFVITRKDLLLRVNYHVITRKDLVIKKKDLGITRKDLVITS